jgi:hypothetical protein
MTKWQYDESIDPGKYFGFIYVITDNVTGKFYTGKKQLYSAQYRPLTKKELEGRDGRSSKKKLVTKESNWRIYNGSCKELLEDIKKYGEDRYTKKIIHWCSNRTQLTYYELHYQVLMGCILPGSNSYNSNILGKFYPDRLI